MKHLALVVAIAVATPGCGFAVKHPAITAGLVAGSMALATCEISTENHTACLTAAPIVGVGLSLVAAAALWLGSEDEETVPELEMEQQPLVDPDAPPDPRPTLPTPALPPPTPTPEPTPPAPEPTTPPTTPETPPAPPPPPPS